jgi:hypothetical protein
MKFMRKYNTIIIFILLLIIGIFLILYSDTFGAFMGYKAYLKAMIKVKDTPGVTLMPNSDWFTLKFEILGVIFAIFGGMGLIIESIIFKYKKLQL